MTERPMDIGGRDGSHHSATLKALARRGLATQKRRAPKAWGECRASYVFRITQAGRAALRKP